MSDPAAAGKERGAVCAHLDMKTDTRLVWVQEKKSFALIIAPYCGACGRRFVCTDGGWLSDENREIGLYVEAEK